jgi:hypothetical protein
MYTQLALAALSLWTAQTAALAQPAKATTTTAIGVNAPSDYVGVGALDATSITQC